MQIGGGRPIQVVATTHARYTHHMLHDKSVTLMLSASMGFHRSQPTYEHEIFSATQTHKTTRMPEQPSNYSHLRTFLSTLPRGLAPGGVRISAGGRGFPI